MLTTLVALIVALGGAERGGSRPRWTARWGSIFEVRQDASGKDEGRLYLIDRESGRCDGLALPSGERWEFVEVSPWSDGAALEAVGRYYRIDAEEGFGMARFRLPGGEIIERIRADVLPTSRPCWVPGRPGRTIFAAGDGRLYRCDFAPGKEAAGAMAEEGGAPRELEWRCPPPSTVPCFLADPSLCSDPRYGTLAVATLISLRYDSRGNQEQSTSFWWFRLDPDATAIEACGLLLDDQPERRGAGKRLQRYPILSVSRDGELALIHLGRDDRADSMEMICVPLEIDPRTGGPRLRPGARPTTIAEGCEPIPPVVAADGRTAYGCSKISGGPRRSPIRPELGEGPAIAGMSRATPPARP
ncbi:hypothetical protein [Aquisphaera insulae]|uniref:hypothetical protein n=1 Tax=Aquisphaera insulae TaxID=2712864 RepID=UPI0013EC9DAC|nr:hypothetical protein [Aquisphaera insulae]